MHIDSALKKSKFKVDTVPTLHLKKPLSMALGIKNRYLDFSI